MPASFGAALGSNAAFVQAGTTNTLSVTTSGAVPSAGRVVVVAYLWDGGASHNARVSAVSDGGAYTRDAQFADGDDIVDIWSLHKSAGLASGTTITATITVDQAFVPTGSWFLSVFYVTGVDSASTVDSTSQNSTGTTWSSGSVSNTVADAIYVGACGYEDVTSGTNNTSMSSGTEIHDLYNSGSQQGLVTGYLAVSSIASRAVSGSLSNANSTLSAGLVAVYHGAGAAAGKAPAISARRFPRALLIR